jgi:hypothetical protein
MRRAIGMLASGLLVAACGGLESPDLGTGTLTGHLANASPAAYLYPLGRPDLAVRPGAGGRYTIEKVPVETAALVVVDFPAGSWLAELVPVDVDGGEERAAPEVDAALLPLAGRVAAVARLGGGCTFAATRFTVAGTDQVDVVPAAPDVAAVLEALPAGAFELRARSDGFTDGHAAITVISGATVPYEIELEVEIGEATPGCLAPGASCRAPLVCGPDDGVCHECLEDADCAGAGAESSCVDRSCREPAAQGEICDPCTQDAECQPGTTCAEDGAFCTRTCTLDSQCPAGMACQPDGARMVCKPPHDCAELEEEIGAECLTDAGCEDDLAFGVCVGADTTADPPTPGYCTGRCLSSADCALVPGYVCGTSNRCEPAL